MKKLRINLFITFSFLLLLCFSIGAQPICGFDRLFSEQIKKNPTFAATIALNEEKIRNFITSHPQPVNENNSNVSAPYIIPIVIHVMNTGGTVGTIYNPSKNQLLAAIEYLNQVYNGTYPGTVGVGDLQIQFELAKRDPNSSCTDGINRIDASSLPGYVANGVNVENSSGCSELALKNFARWEPNDYYNVWIVNKIDGNDGTSGQFIAGFAHFPGISSSLDGIVMLATQMGVGLKTLPHEIGHAFNLYHTFQGSTDYLDCPLNLFCSINGDKVCDTDPVTNNVSGGIFNFECRTGANPCTNSTYNDNTEKNYMAYTNCYNLFTNGQKERMQAAMSLSSRETLVRNNNLALISPVADLTIINPSASPYSVMPGDDIAVYFAEDNNGSSHASANYINFHLSPDDILTPGLNGDIYLGQYFVNQILAPFSQTILLNKQINIPSSVNPGSYYLFLAADGTGVVNECIEDNNFASVLITVTGSCSDLAIVNQSVAPTTTIVGNSVTAYFAEYNSGNVSAASNYVNFHLSPDNILTPGLNGDIYLDQYFINQSIPPQTQTTVFNKQLIIPSVPPGIYYLFFAADGTGIVNECDDTNNFATATISVSDTLSTTQASYRYWFDNQFANAVSLNMTNGNIHYLQNSISTNFLQSGLHTFNIAFKDLNNQWSSTSSSFFYKLGITSAENSSRYEYWFDNNSSTRTVKNISNISNLMILDSLNTIGLTGGLHTINFRFKPDGKRWSSVSSSFFYKIPAPSTGTPKYQYWFDEKFQDSVTVVVGSTNNLILLDSLINTQPVGLHTLNMRFKPDGGLWSSVTSSFFYKNPVTNNNSIARCVYWYDNNWQNPNIVFYSGHQNLSAIINTDADSLSLGMHRVSMMFRDDNGSWSSVVSDSFNRVAITSPACPINNKQFISRVYLSNTSTKQWQVDIGSGFANIQNNSIYSGANADTLQLTNAPTSWYGYKYRCVVTEGSSSINSELFTLRFSQIWKGTSDAAWENPANWNCNTLPDVNTDVIIMAGTTNYPEVSTSGTCRSLITKTGVNIVVKTGATFVLGQ